METPANGTIWCVRSVLNSPALLVKVESGIGGLLFSIGVGYQVQTAPCRELLEPARRRQADMTRHLELHPRGKRQPLP
jgi:hypothetical protein